VSIETLAYEPARRDEVFELLERVRGYPTDEEEFDWWFDGNPVGPRTIALAQEDGRLAGVLGATFYRTVVHGRETLAALPLWAVTDEAFRGRGIFQRLNAEVERVAREAGATLELGFTNRMAGPIYIAKLGWLDVHRLRVWARPLLPLPGSDPKTPLQRFVHTHEEAYRAVAPRWASHFVRDTAYLNWRYADSPRGYRMLDAPLGGCAVVGFARRRGLRVGLLMELIAEGEDVAELVTGSLAAARGAVALLAVPSPVLSRSRLLRHGFLPTPYRLDFMGKGLAEPLETRSSAWTVSLGDTDFF
jgi:GNAT superfamily N-acetyltransferase